MQPDTQNASLTSWEFPEDALLIFIGHSDDAKEEALAIKSLQSTLDNDFQTYLNLQGQNSHFHSLKLWEWTFDASSKTGGQKNVVDPFLYRAQIALFVFKERAGTVTWEELENAQKRSKENRSHILVFFPDCPPGSVNLSKHQPADDWATLLKRKESLTSDWTNQDSYSVTPCPEYKNIEHLKEIALERLKSAITHILTPDISPRTPISPPFDCLIGDIKDINFDRRPVLTHRVDELDGKLVEKFLAKPLSVRLLRKANLSSHPDYAERLAALGCVTGHRPSLGAFLCFAPSRLLIDKFASCSLHVVRYQGTSRILSPIEMFPMCDNLLNLFEQGMNWLVSEAHLGRSGRVGSTNRDDLEIPEIAFREALANALVHRDYEDTLNRDQPTRIDVYDDRVEITSYGTLAGSVTLDQLNQYSDKLSPFRRNSVIASIFLNMTNVELNATGIARMRYAMQKALLPPPIIKIHDGVVVVCFERPVVIDSDTRQPVELRKRALVSGAMTGLDSFRNAAFTSCFQAGYFPVMMEHHPADVNDAILLSNTMVDNADVYVGICTYQYGYVPAGLEKSIHEIEYTRVKERKNLPRFLFALNQDVIENEASDNESHRQKQLKFREAVALESVLINVVTADELQTKLAECFKKSDDGFVLGVEKRYQAALKEELGYIRMLGLPGVESIKVNLNNDTFVPLRLSDRHEIYDFFSKESDREANEHILYPDEVIKRAFHDRRGRRMLLIIGDPGAGKTTLLKYYALCALEDFAKLGFRAPVHVFYLPLRDLVRDKEGRCSKKLPATLATWTEKHHQPIDEKIINDWLNNDSSLVLLDGLDEISNIEERKEVCRWIDNAFSGFSKAFFMVTSRATGYRKDEGIELTSEYERADVQDFTAEQQERFLRNWFTAAFLKEPCEKGIDEKRWQEKQKKEAEKRTTTIVAHLKVEKNKGLRQLAAIPMILQIMAILWKEREYMPESRVELYDAALNYLLEFRDKRRDIKPLLSAIDARQVLGPVSLWMQDTLKKDEAAKAEMYTEMQKWLDTLYRAPTAENFCDFLFKRAGLFAEAGGKEYFFRHKSFREYLAGVQLKEDRPYEQLNALVAHFGEDWWEEPLRFFIASVDAKVFDAFMAKLFDSPQSDEMTQKQQLLLQTIIEEAKGKKVDALCNKLLDPATTASRQRVILDCLKAIDKPASLEALLEFREKKLARENKDIINRTEEVILALGGEVFIRESEKPSRRTSLSFRNSYEQNAEYVYIPGGRYIYSVTKKEEHVEDLYVAKYPVTNRLYRSFIASLQPNSSSAILPSFNKEINTIAKNNAWGNGFGSYLNECKNNFATFFCSEYDEDRKFGGEDQPVVGVTWYAAQAYCLWLSLFEADQPRYRLLNEIEWEWAASGMRGEVVQNGRHYPWREEHSEPSSTLANYGNNVGVTTPVGNYPDGATPEGLYDMAGNVWEWMDNLYDKYAIAHSLRGGSWNSGHDYLRCSSRSYYIPENRSINFGFRVVREKVTAPLKQ